MNSKALYKAGAGSLLLAGSLYAANAWQAGGYVACDANQNGQIDAGDVGLSGVLVIVTNASGTFSNANWSSTTDGGFAIELPPVADTYVSYMHPQTLPANATITLPAAGFYTFSFDGVTESNFLGSFLVTSSICVENPPPPPPPPGDSCCLVGGGKIGKHKPQFAIAGSVRPGENKGEWSIVAHALRLKFEGEVLEILNCGEEEGPTPGSVIRFMEFRGAGILKGIAGCKVNYGLVHFDARVEDLGGGKNCADRLYFRAYAEDGTTLLLISADTENPLNAATVAITRGGFVIRTSGCEDECPDDDDDDGDGNGHDDGDRDDKDKCKDDKGKGPGDKDKEDKGDKGKGNGKGGDKDECEDDKGKGHGDKDQGNKGKGDAHKGKGDQGNKGGNNPDCKDDNGKKGSGQAKQQKNNSGKDNSGKSAKSGKSGSNKGGKKP